MIATEAVVVAASEEVQGLADVVPTVALTRHAVLPPLVSTTVPKVVFAVAARVDNPLVVGRAKVAANAVALCCAVAPARARADRLARAEVLSKALAGLTFEPLVHQAIFRGGPRSGSICKLQPLATAARRPVVAENVVTAVTIAVELPPRHPVDVVEAKGNLLGTRHALLRALALGLIHRLLRTWLNALAAHLPHINERPPMWTSKTSSQSGAIILRIYGP